MDRKALRKEMIKKRSLIDASELRHLSDCIARITLSASWYQASRCIHCFFGVAEKGEISTLKILNHVINSGKILVMPRVAGHDGHMEHIRVRNLDSLAKGAWGIQEPAEGEHFNIDDIDLIFVPGLAADRNGNRLGYGKGYYDRFLSTAAGARKVMLVPDDFMLGHIPAKKHDVPVDALVTETGEIVCR